MQFGSLLLKSKYLGFGGKFQVVPLEGSSFDIGFCMALQDGFWARFWGCLLRVGHYPFTFFLKYHFFMHIILILFCLLSPSFIAKGLTMCRLGRGGDYYSNSAILSLVYCMF